MAKVRIEYDTVQKTMSCEMDGVEMEGAREVSFYRSGKEWLFSVMSAAEDKDNDVRTYTHVTAEIARDAGKYQKDVDEYFP